MNYLGLNTDKTKSTVEQLNVLLADYHLYYQKLRNFHWNVIGKKISLTFMKSLKNCMKMRK